MEFTTQYVDPETGELKSAWQLLVENTDPRYVTFQLDVGWATVAGEDAVALVKEFDDRIELLHVKDAIVTVPGGGNEAGFQQTTIGQGDVDWASLFDAAQGDVKLYVIEMDPRVHLGIRSRSPGTASSTSTAWSSDRLKRRPSPQ